MVKYFCDVCGKECNGTLFGIPHMEYIGTQYHSNCGEMLFEYKPKEKMLCDNCCKKVVFALKALDKTK